MFFLLSSLAGLVDEFGKGDGLVATGGEDFFDILLAEVLAHESFHIEDTEPTIEYFAAGQVGAGGTTITEV